MIAARAVRGWSQTRLAHEAETSLSNIFALEALAYGKLPDAARAIAERVATALGLEEHEVLPSGAIESIETTRGEVRDVPLSRLLAAAPERFLLPSPADVAELKDEVESALSRLKEREEVVLRGRYLEGLTLDELGAKFGVSGERIRGIEGQALTHLAPCVRSALEDGRVSSAR